MIEKIAYLDVVESNYMKQPELGKKLTELRKAKGLTQEEVVERCNVSVRTIQRIENGEVVPRSYTVRTILTALGYNFDEVFTEETISKEETKDGFSVKPASHEQQSSTLQVNRFQLTLALIFGFIYFLLTFPETFIEIAKFAEGTLVVGSHWYIILKASLLISFVIFQLGFIHIGKLFDNYLLRFAAIIHIAFITCLYIYDVASINSFDDQQLTAIPIAILYGATAIFYGVALLKLRFRLGRTVLVAGALELMAGCLFFTVVLFPLADIVSMFAELAQLAVVYKVMESKVTSY